MITEPVRSHLGYRVEITKPGVLLYSIDISNGLTGSDPYHAFTLNGARRKAKRIVNRQRRSDVRRKKIIDSWAEPDG